MYSLFSLMSVGTPTIKSTTTSQAPSANLTTTKISTMISDVTPAEKLITTRRRHADSLTLWWYLAMPNPAMVNAVKTPIA